MRHPNQKQTIQTKQNIKSTKKKLRAMTANHKSRVAHSEGQGRNKSPAKN